MTTSPKDLALDPYVAKICDIDPSKRPRHRYRCPDKDAEVAGLGKVICASGAIQYKSYCLTCGGKGSDLPHYVAEGLDGERITVLTRHEVVPCERCGSNEGSEVHHWAPAHLFEDSLDWPTSHLCRKCHLEWHRIVTPRMSTVRRAA